MNIKQPEKTTVTFSSIEQGDVFEYCGRYYMKVEELEFYDDNNVINAVNLTNGDMSGFVGYELVAPLPSAELIF